jgi:hypothetical protein
MDNQLAQAKELVEVLEQIGTTTDLLSSLQERRGELVTGLAGQATPLGPPAPKAAKKGEGKSAPTPTVNTDSVKAELAELEASGELPTEPLPGQLTDAEVTAQAEEAKQPKPTEAEAMADYEANVDPASAPQRNMIFGILGKQFGIKDPAEVKQVIKSILASQHHGETIESISKELSKEWAKGLIDYLTTAKQADVMKHLEVPFK